MYINVYIQSNPNQIFKYQAGHVHLCKSTIVITDWKDTYVHACMCVYYVIYCLQQIEVNMHGSGFG